VVAELCFSLAHDLQENPLQITTRFIEPEDGIDSIRD
jgi:hypothetical protein